MWHEARKQEKKIRGMMVDYRKRAERRRDFYEKFKADPTQFLQLHGRPCKIHLDPAVAVAGDSASVMMPWQGHPDILIDRFDVRAHLDTIIETPSTKNEEEILNYEERTMNYERYRILVQNEFLGVNEEKFLNQIYLEEQFGPIALKQSTEMLEKEKRKRGVTIGFTYEDSTPDAFFNALEKKPKEETADKDASDSDDSDLDFDLCLDLSQIDTPSAHEMNAVGQRFGLTGNDFFSFLTNDVEEQEAMRLARQQEEEKAMFSGRKARRERQAFREKKLIGRVMSPPSYAARKSPTYDKYSRCNKSQSRSTSPENTGQITYITSFGGDDSNDEKQDEKSTLSKNNKRTRKRGERDDRSSKFSSHRSRRSKSLGSRSRSKSPRRRRKYTRSRSIENRSLASNLKKLISKKNERRSRSGSSDKFRSYSKWRSRSRSRSRRRSWSSRSRSGSSRSRRGRSKSSRSGDSSKKRTSSRSNTSKSHSRSRSTSRDKSKIRKRSSSISFSSSNESQKKEESPPKIVVPRYYGRNRKDSSSSLSLDSSDSDSKTNSGQPSGSCSNRSNSKRVGLDDYHSSSRSAGNARPTSKSLTKEKPQEKLKKKMQALLNKQFKADKKAEKERLEKAEQERQDREAELRDIAIKIRRRERYLRHRGEDEENDGEKEAMRRRERYLRRLGEEDAKREKRDGDSRSGSSGSRRSRSNSSDSKSRRSRSPRRNARRSRSPSPKASSRLGKRKSSIRQMDPVVEGREINVNTRNIF